MIMAAIDDVMNVDRLLTKAFLESCYEGRIFRENPRVSAENKIIGILQHLFQTCYALIVCS